MSEIEKAIRFLKKNRDAIQDNQLIPQTIKDEVSMPLELAIQALQEKGAENDNSAKIIDLCCFDEQYGRGFQCSVCEAAFIGKQNFCPECGRRLVEE